MTTLNIVLIIIGIVLVVLFIYYLTGWEFIYVLGDVIADLLDSLSDGDLFDGDLFDGD